MTEPVRSRSGFIADTMVLAIFVDAGQFDLLVALAGDRLFITPTVADVDEAPPFDDEPRAEFARGLYRGQGETSALHINRVMQRMAFYQAAGKQWSPVTLNVAELLDAQRLMHPATRRSQGNQSGFQIQAGWRWRIGSSGRCALTWLDALER